MQVEEVHKEWAERLRSRRTLLGLSQDQLAEHVDVTQAAISAIERGQAVPSDDLKWRLAGALGCRITDLFSFPAHTPPFPEPKPARKTVRS